MNMQSKLLTVPDKYSYIFHKVLWEWLSSIGSTELA